MPYTMFSSLASVASLPCTRDRKWKLFTKIYWRVSNCFRLLPCLRKAHDIKKRSPKTLDMHVEDLTANGECRKNTNAPLSWHLYTCSSCLTSLNAFLDKRFRRQIVSTTFYDNKLKTAEELKLKRRSYEPCKWVHVSGGEVKHHGRVRPRKELGIPG